ncbi:MAG: hypothetical protein QGF84_03060 [Candidatus Thioglobus sp.]|nr:hypothetical protein [Candidatus Thioglobus sp.]
MLEGSALPVNGQPPYPQLDSPSAAFRQHLIQEYQQGKVSYFSSIDYTIFSKTLNFFTIITKLI